MWDLEQAILGLGLPGLFIKTEIQAGGDPKVHGATEVGLPLASDAKFLGTLPGRRHGEGSEHGWGKLDNMRPHYDGKTQMIPTI